MMWLNPDGNDDGDDDDDLDVWMCGCVDVWMCGRAIIKSFIEKTQ